MISVKDSLAIGIMFRDISIRNKAVMSVKTDAFEDVRQDARELSILEKFFEDLRLDEFFEELSI